MSTATRETPQTRCKRTRSIAKLNSF
jgi:hypothetical protein